MTNESDNTQAQPDQPEVAANSVSRSGEATKPMPKGIFYLELGYIILLAALIAFYAMWSGFRNALPISLGPLPLGVVWFGSVGGVVAGFRGIYGYNHNWDSSYNYWHYTRPIFGAVTGAIGSLIYWVLLRFGNTSTTIKVDRVMFYVVAFVLGFSDKAFIELLTNITDVIIKPGQSKAGSKGVQSGKNTSQPPSAG